MSSGTIRFSASRWPAAVSRSTSSLPDLSLCSSRESETVRTAMATGRNSRAPPPCAYDMPALPRSCGAGSHQAGERLHFDFRARLHVTLLERQDDEAVGLAHGTQHACALVPGAAHCVGTRFLALEHAALELQSTRTLAQAGRAGRPQQERRVRLDGT